MPVEVRSRVFSDAGSIPAISTWKTQLNEQPQADCLKMGEVTMVVRSWFGSVLVVLGLGLLADQLYPALAFGEWLARLWPLAIILLGVILLLTRAATWFGGVFILIIGGLLQIAALGLLNANVWGLIWPSFLILLGIWVVFRLGRPAIKGDSSGDAVNHFVIFSGMDTRPQAANFRGGSITAAFGGADIDLRDVKLAKEGAFMELTAAFGGINVVIPREWKVNIDGLPLFGGWSNKTTPSSVTEGSVLTIRCLAMFGAIEVKN
jgi:predicted membrane protein